MSISESQLETWSHQGPTSQFTSTYQTLKNVLHSNSAPYASRSFETFLQGSYANDTNIYADSDVDIVLKADEVYYSDTSNLTEEDKKSFDQGWVRATYTLDDFKNEVVTWLRSQYGSAVHVGPKAISIAGSGSRRDADVIVCAEFRRYQQFKTSANQSYHSGICFFLPDNTRIENFPKQHSADCTTKHQATNRLFKPTVRVYKNLRNKLITDGRLADGVAPSYFLEGLLYNVPPDRFGGTHSANFLDTLNWIIEADRSKFECANELYYLLNDHSPVTWTAAKCNTLLSAAVALWNE
jgi:hypothetical protein